MEVLRQRPDISGAAGQELVEVVLGARRALGGQGSPRVVGGVALGGVELGPAGGRPAGQPGQGLLVAFFAGAAAALAEALNGELDTNSRVYGLGVLCAARLALGERDEAGALALQALDAAHAEAPSAAFASMGLALLTETLIEVGTQGNIDAAVEEYERAEALLPGESEPIFWHAVTLASVGRVDESLPLFAEAYRLRPEWRELVPRLAPAQLLPDDPEMIAKIVAAGR